MNHIKSKYKPTEFSSKAVKIVLNFICKHKYLRKSLEKSGMVVHVCSPSYSEVEVGESFHPQIQDQHGQCSEISFKRKKILKRRVMVRPGALPPRY
jgi:hypothetical protein